MVVVLGLLCFTAACEKDVLPQPDFPLEEAVITSALKTAGLPGIISDSETESYAEGHIKYVVRSQTEAYSDKISPEEAQANPSSRVIIAGVDSSISEGERTLSIIFDQKDVPEQFAWEDWKKQIVFAALLYGGFEDEEDVYQAFAGKELPKSGNLKELPENERPLEWDAQLPGGYCQVFYEPRIIQTIDGEYGIPMRRQSGTMIVKIFKSQTHFQKNQE